MKQTVLILGGAGFIGSNIAARFYDEAYKVNVIDGLMTKTSGRRKNLEEYRDKIGFINKPIEEIENLDELVESSDIIIDAMAWTSHRLALSDPEYDQKLNLNSHLCLIRYLKYFKGRIIYLGSRGQYGNPRVEVIEEDTQMLPEDVQGIHKLASESYFRVYAKKYNLKVLSLRIPNCFGENQPIEGEDIGLIGGFFRDILDRRIVEIYGQGRKRNIIYVKDLVDIVFKLSCIEFEGFVAYNIAGTEILIEDLVKQIIKVCDRGEYKIKELPSEIENIDIGQAKFSDEKLRSVLHEMKFTGLDLALSNTFSYVKQNLEV